MPKAFYFAWVDADTDFDEDVHNVTDEDVFSFTLTQNEGDFATLSITIKNPKVGLLKTGRKVWCWFSYNNGSDITPLFKGRLIGVPTSIFQTLVTLEFTARPADYTTRKAALAETLRVAPFWDPLFIKPESWLDDDLVLEGRSAMWHIDPVTHEVTTSDVISPEDGVVEYTASQIFADSVQITLPVVPLRSVSVKADIPWLQSAVQSYELGGYIRTNWTPTSFVEGSPWGIQSFTFEGLVSDWPKVGTKIGKDWIITRSELVNGFTAVPDTDVSVPVTNFSQGIPQPNLYISVPEGSEVFHVTHAYGTGNLGGGVYGSFSYDTVIYAPLGFGYPTLEVTFDIARDFTETIAFTLNAATQSVVTLPGDDDVIAINLTANSASDLDYDGTLPIGDVRRRTFSDSDRGQQAVQHLIQIARANLVMRSRAVQIAFDVKLDDGLDVTLRKGALLHDSRIPDGSASGKVVAYTHQLDGASGRAYSTITVGCAVGYGGSYTESDGDATYIEDGYIDETYYERHNVVQFAGTEDVTYTMPAIAPWDDGWDLINIKDGHISAREIVTYFHVENGPDVQRDALHSVGGVTTHDPVFTDAYVGTLEASQLSAAIQDIPTVVTLQLAEFGTGPFVGETTVTVSDLIIPQQINLEAT